MNFGSPGNVIPAIEALIDELRLDDFVLYGEYHLSPSVLEFAAEHAQLVSRLILCSGFVRLSEVGAGSAVAHA